MKKTILAMLLSLTLAFGLSSCGSPEVSGPVDREPLPSTDSKTSEDGTSAEESSVEESSTEGAAENSTALKDWYDSSNRETLENTINQMYASSGMTFSVSIEEPGTIIYIYQYTEPIGDETNREELQNYFRTSLDSQYQTFINEIQDYRNLYDIPLTTIRLSYLDTDGTDLYTMDFTEDYVPLAEDASSSQEFASLEDWLNSEEKKLVVSAVNTQLESSGIAIDFYAEGNVLVMDYIYTEQQNLEGLSQEDIASVFDEQVAPTFSSMVASLFDSFESDYGLVLDDIKLVFRNADNTEIYSKYFSEL